MYIIAIVLVVALLLAAFFAWVQWVIDGVRKARQNWEG